jgi:hypothetical protein
MKYLLKQLSGNVKGIIQLPEDVATPSGYITLTKSEYDLGISAQNKDTFLLWDDENRTFSADQNLGNIKTSINSEKSTQMAQLRSLSVDIDLYDKIGDATTKASLQADFDALKEILFPI